MAYATVEEFISNFGEDEAVMLSNLDDPQAVTVNESVIVQAISDSSSLIDGYLRSAGYTLPLSAEVQVLTRAASDIARYYLDRLKPREDVKARYDGWLKWLGDVARGNVKLSVVGGGASVDIGGYGAESWSGGSVFNAESLRDY